MSILNLKNNSFSFYWILIISCILFFDLPKNIFSLINFDYEKRMIKIYGYCYPQAYGFIKEIKSKYNLNNVETINFDDFAQSDFFLNNPKQKKNGDYRILINFDKNLHTNFSINNYKIILNKQKCFLVKKKND
jgi:hypothetical protein